MIKKLRCNPSGGTVACTPTLVPTMLVSLEESFSFFSFPVFVISNDIIVVFISGGCVLMLGPVLLLLDPA